MVFSPFCLLWFAFSQRLSTIYSRLLKKSDLENKRQVTYDDARTLADELNVSYYETSAKTGDNIDNVFKELIQVVEEIIRNDENGWINMKLSKIDKLVLEHDNNNRHKYCYGYSGKC